MDTVQKVSGVDFPVELWTAGRATRQPGGRLLEAVDDHGLEARRGCYRGYRARYPAWERRRLRSGRLGAWVSGLSGCLGSEFLADFGPITKRGRLVRHRARNLKQGSFMSIPLMLPNWIGGVGSLHYGRGFFDKISRPTGGGCFVAPLPRRRTLRCASRRRGRTARLGGVCRRGGAA